MMSVPYRKTLLGLWVMLICIAGAVRQAEAAFGMFINIDEIPGESKDDKHKDWIEGLRFSHSMKNTGTVSAGGGAGAGKTEHGRFVITKRLDKTSPFLALNVNNGKHIKKVTVELARTGQDRTTYMIYTLEDVIISSVTVEGDAEKSDSMPVEEISFSYGKISWTYSVQDPQTGKPKDVKTSWDVLQNKGQ